MSIVAKSIADKLSSLDVLNAKVYEKNYEKFKKEWDTKLLVWAEKMKPFEGVKVIQYHKSFDYFLKRYKMKLVDTIEPIPGISPTSKHIIELITKIKSEKEAILIMHDVYHNRKAAKLISAKTNIKIMDMPHDVDALSEANSIENLFNSIIDSLNK